MIRVLVAAWRRMVGEARVVHLALDLRVRGHRKAARMAGMWTADSPSKDEVARVRAALLRRYPGR